MTPRVKLYTPSQLRGDAVEYSCGRHEYSGSDKQRRAQMTLTSSSSGRETSEPHLWTRTKDTATKSSLELAVSRRGLVLILTVKYIFVSAAERINTHNRAEEGGVTLRDSSSRMNHNLVHLLVSPSHLGSLECLEVRLCSDSSGVTPALSPGLGRSSAGRGPASPKKTFQPRQKRE